MCRWRPRPVPQRAPHATRGTGTRHKHARGISVAGRCVCTRTRMLASPAAGGRAARYWCHRPARVPRVRRGATRAPRAPRCPACPEWPEWPGPNSPRLAVCASQRLERGRATAAGAGARVPQGAGPACTGRVTPQQCIDTLMRALHYICMPAYTIFPLLPLGASIYIPTRHILICTD